MDIKIKENRTTNLFILLEIKRQTNAIFCDTKIQI